ncbi:ABC transporter permease [Virgibacillus siamensis]|uniref:ABC transporter permease n=1 Tax=Virgibacillus siamensis TaxID=480071 RepID=UPI000986209F|nr:ABC transporter permease [Virgibacillus siamensis]
MNVHRIQAIFEKDLKDFMKNMMLLMMPTIPIILALLYSRLGKGDEELPLFMLYMIVGITFSTVTSSCMMTMMAEENEKKTLRGLVLSPASFIDILVGKSLVTGLMTAISLVISLLIAGIDPFLAVKPIIGMVLLFLFFLFLGIGIGLFAKTVAATSAYLMPVMFLFGFTPMFNLLGIDEDSIVTKIINVFPLPQLIKMHEDGSWFPLGIVLIWVIAAAAFMALCFRKRSTDD